MQCYAEAPGSAVERPVRWLVGFVPVRVGAGATSTARLRVPLDRLAYWDVGRDGFVVEPISYRLVVAPHAAAPGTATTLDLRDRPGS